jgi:transposase InsO family protein
LIDSLKGRFAELSPSDIYTACLHSRSQLYRWRRAETLDRKIRQPKELEESVLENAAKVISTFPHFGGGKGQTYMLYHRLGFIGQKAYDGIKRRVRRLLCQELSRRNDLPAGGEEYEHIRPEEIGQIWAEDFTEIVLEGMALKMALLIDVFSQYILGWALAHRADENLVSTPVHQALEKNGGHGPEKFLLRDNGKQYASESHGELLAAHEIIERNIPAFTPQYNGAVECGGKEFKNVFYNVWELQEREGTDKEKTLLERAEAAAAETVDLLNEKIPRPALEGISPADVHRDRKEAIKKEIENYRQGQEEKGKAPPLSRPYWEVLKSGVKAEEMSTKELLIKLAFFGMRPLRRVAHINRNVWGN